MAPNLSSEFATILSISFVFYMVNDLLADEDRRKIGSAILAVLTKKEAQDSGYFFRAVATVFRSIFRSARKL